VGSSLAVRIPGMLPASWRQIGPTPVSSALIIVTAITLFLADYLAVWLASGQRNCSRDGAELIAGPTS
jgi:hypothetical protein